MNSERPEVRSAIPARQDVGRRIAWSAARRLSRVGSAIGLDWLTYNPGVFMQFHWLALQDAPRMADALTAHVPAFASLADVGCGSGAFAAEFLRRGIRIGACEYSFWGRWYARRLGVAAGAWDLSRSHDAIDGAPFDVAMSLEVAEHVPAKLADAFVSVLVASARQTIVLTAAHPGQGGQGHVNEQPQAYWIEKFEKHPWQFDSGMSTRVAEALRQSRASGWLRQNMMIFRRVAPHGDTLTA